MKTPSRMQQFAAFLIGIASILPVMPTAHADDIEIYNSQTPDPSQPPFTIVALDLNLLQVCDNVLTNPTSNPGCGALQSTLNLQTYLNLIGGESVFENGLAALPRNVLCQLNALLPIPLVNTLLCNLLGSVASLVTGLQNNVLSAVNKGTLLNALPGAVISILDAALAAPLKILANPAQAISVLEGVLNKLINFQVAVIVSHANRSNANGTPVVKGGVNYACTYGEELAIPTTRRETTNCSNGAYFLVGATPLVDQGSVTTLVTKVTNLLGNVLNPATLLNALTSLSVSQRMLLPPYQGKEIYAEIIRYMGGEQVFNAPLNRWDGLISVLGRDTTIESGSNYIAPTLHCKSANVLNIMLTNSLGDNDSDAVLQAKFPAANITDHSFTQTGFANLVDAASEEFTLANGNKLKLNSYFLLQDNLSGLTALQNVGANVQNYTNVTGLLGLGQGISDLLKPTLVVNASLLTPTLTLDITAPNKLIDSAFFSGFKPEDNARVAWKGNLKKLKLVNFDQGSSAEYRDSNNTDAIATDGRISSGALTLWTDSTTIPGTGKDGREVTLGGAGARIPGFSVQNTGRSNSTTGKRQLFYDKLSGTGAPSLSAIEPDTASMRSDVQTDLGAASDTIAQELLLYARGFDVGTSTNSKGTSNSLVARSWIHGATLHARPVAINYGARTGYSASNPDVRIVYGATDGFLRMIKNTETNGTQSGVESWGFMPRVVMKQQKILRDNTPNAVFPYGVDGTPTALVIDRGTATGGVAGPADGIINHTTNSSSGINDINDSADIRDHALVYFGLRRGGSFYYALDVTNPDAPSLKWRIGTDGLRNSTGLVNGSDAWFSELGLTFSTPKVARMRVKDGSVTRNKFVLIFGGGYNGGRDGNNVRLAKDLNRGSSALVGTNDSKGNTLYIVDAETGQLIWKAKNGTFNSSDFYNDTTYTYAHPLLNDSIPSEVTMVDTGGDGFADRFYVADTGGRLWRGDMPNADRNTWTLTPLASVGRHEGVSSNVVAQDRRFFHAPDYVPIRGTDKNYDVVLFASGDREDPLNRTGVNWLYAYRDTVTTSGKLATDVTTTEAALKHHGDFTDLTTTCGTNSAVTCADISTLTPGWRLKLSATGEKALSQPLTLGGTVFLSTYVPPTAAETTCEANEGTGRIYAVSLNNSRQVYTQWTENGGRANKTAAPGLTGEVNLASVSTVTAGAETFDSKARKFYPIYWRERRGDDESAP